MDKNPQYYQGILQLRNPPEEALNFVKNQLAHDAKVWVAKEEKFKTGIDLYLSSNKFLLQLGKKLKKSFKGKLIISRRIHTTSRITSKEVYRVTVCFRFD
ncbi:MAG TPA: NMD3-related protein [Candidatus Nanoarchaeia archaeon]|nr:NMD3-related protein [Candidatus Nanoarchaeia archaeon]